MNSISKIIVIFSCVVGEIIRVPVAGNITLCTFKFCHKRRISW